MSQGRRRARIESIDQAIASAIWVALDLLSLASNYCDDEDTVAAIYAANSKLLDALTIIRKSDWAEVPF